MREHFELRENRSERPRRGTKERPPPPKAASGSTVKHTWYRIELYCLWWNLLYGTRYSVVFGCYNQDKGRTTALLVLLPVVCCGYTVQFILPQHCPTALEHGAAWKKKKKSCNSPQHYRTVQVALYSRYALLLLAVLTIIAIVPLLSCTVTIAAAAVHAVVVRSCAYKIPSYIFTYIYTSTVYIHKIHTSYKDTYIYSINK